MDYLGFKAIAQLQRKSREEACGAHFFSAGFLHDFQYQRAPSARNDNAAAFDGNDFPRLAFQICAIRRDARLPYLD